MKCFLLVASALILATAAKADTNIALGGTGISGENPNIDTTFTGSNGYSFGDSQLNDGTTNSGNVSTFGQAPGTDGFVGITFSAPVTGSVTNVIFYGGLFADGGWFGLSGHDANGTAVTGGATAANYPSTLSASALIAPTLQVSYDYSASNPGASTWVTVGTTDDYVNQVGGDSLPILFGGAGPTPPATFTLDSSVTGITGIRLIGEAGGFASGGGGFLGGQELQVLIAPDPATVAMVLGGMALLGFCLRRKVALLT